MPLVIDTFNDYFFYLQYRRRNVPLTIKANKLALQYFSSLYGQMETNKLSPTHMVRFHELLLQTKRQQKNENGDYELLSRYSIYKVMVKLRAYIKRLKAAGHLGDLEPIDVPVGNIPRPIPKYITKEDLKKIFRYLDERVNKANIGKSQIEKYQAHLYRAIVRFLYTSGLRNAELRNLKTQDLNLNDLLGAVLGKGNKYAAITFSETAKQHLVAYREVRSEIFPGVRFDGVFTPYRHEMHKVISEQGLNQMVKMIGANAGVTTKTNAHIYRHTLATHLVQSGCSIVSVRDKMRHSSLSVTNGYTHSSPFEQMSITKGIDAICCS